MKVRLHEKGADGACVCGTACEARHTPGPWKVGTGWIFASPDGSPKGATVICNINVGPVNDENARLIAAAPDLLLALKAVKIMADAKAAELDGGADYHAVAADMMTRMAHLSHRIGDAISKAEGR